MRFEECGLQEIEKIGRTFIYFLLDDNDEVVYVGQTSVGISRPFQHTDKNFTRIMVMQCEPKELDVLEDRYIKKYLPKYNKQANVPMNYSLHRASMSLKETYPKFNMWRLKRILKDLDIEPFEFCGVKYITKREFELVEKYEGEKGVVAE